jgi:hypothetical protein
MAFQLLLGTALIAITALVQVVFMAAAMSCLHRNERWIQTPPLAFKTASALVLVLFWLMIAITASVWLWAHVFLYLEVFTERETALYFSTVTFTTLGYGDIVLENRWRFLSSLTAVNGLIVFGLSTAFLVEFMRSINHIHRGEHRL